MFGPLQSVGCHIGLARFNLNRRDLVGNPCQVFNLSRGGLRICPIQEIDRAMRIAVQHPQLGSDQKCRSVIGPHIHHPLRIYLGFRIVAERDVCLGKIPIGHHIVRRAAMENCSPVPRLGKFMAAQQEDYLSFLQLKVFRIQFHSLSKSCIGILQVLGIGSLAGPPKTGECQLVVRLHPLRIRRDLLLSRRDALLRRSLFLYCCLAGRVILIGLRQDRLLSASLHGEEDAENE